MKTRGLITGTAIAALLAYPTGPSRAQEDTGGLRVSLGLQQTFGTADNLSLGVPGSVANPEEGRTSLSTTAFALNIGSETRNERFSLQLAGAFRFGSTPAGSRIDTGFVDPGAALHYSREGANAVFSFDATYSQSAISLARPLWNFQDEENVISPPSDLANLQGTGEREESSLRFNFETGINAPIGFRLSGNANQLRYDNATSAALTDNDSATVLLSTYLRFNPATTAVIDLRATRFDDSSALPPSETRTVEAGFNQSLASGAVLSARLGYTDSDPGNTGLNAGASGVSGSLSYSRPLVDGSFGASFTQTRTTNGSIERISMRRGFDLATGSLSVDIGATSLQGGSPKLTGGVNWQRLLATGSFTLSFNRGVTTDSNNEDIFTTRLAAQYLHQVNASSSLFANLSYFESDGTTTTNKISRTDISMGYSYELTEDWNLNAGVNLRTRDESLGGAPGSTTVGRAKSNEIFVSVSRKFDLY